MEKLISWVEIPAENFDRAVKFYNTILNLKLETENCGDDKMACFPTGEGAVFSKPGSKPSQNGVIINLDVKDKLDETIQKIEENGGKIVKQKTKMESGGQGHFALFIDSEGNKLGLNGK